MRQSGVMMVLSGMSSFVRSSEPLLMARAISTDIARIEVCCAASRHEQDRSISVILYGTTQDSASTPADPEPKRLEQMQIQVWVLRRDGTTLKQLPGRPPPATPCQARAVALLGNTQIFRFERAPDEEIAAVVISVDGVPHVRGIRQGDARTVSVPP